ncbi:MAG TPA: zinc-binding dehydrogenase [Gemmatimonadales bacterium]|nr:zinc-binding dehydrogenase [Gemmatimonadales bacterium]
MLEASAAVVTGPRAAAVRRVPKPVPGPGDVLVRLEGCGVCGSSLPFWEGRSWFTYPGDPGAPGHEGWGVVEAVGDEVTTVRAGDRVAALSFHAFAEYDLAEADAVVPLPESLARQPFPGEAIGAAVNALQRGSVRAGDTVVVIGIGFLGAILTRLAAGAGARVVAVSRRPYALEVARAQGADVALPFESPERIVREVSDLTGGTLADRVFEAVGLQHALDLAGELTRIRGTLVIAGYHQDGPRTVDMQLWNWRGLDVINAHEREPAAYVRGIREAVSLVSDGRLDPAPLYTHRFPLDRAGEALEAMRTRPDGFLKALVTP